jgi:hypothetical protein
MEAAVAGSREKSAAWRRIAATGDGRRLHALSDSAGDDGCPEVSGGGRKADAAKGKYRAPGTSCFQVATAWSLPDAIILWIAGSSDPNSKGDEIVGEKRR